MDKKKVGIRGPRSTYERLKILRGLKGSFFEPLLILKMLKDLKVTLNLCSIPKLKLFITVSSKVTGKMRNFWIPLNVDSDFFQI